MAFSRGDWYSPAPLWQNGPSPGGLYDFPSRNPHISYSTIPDFGKQHTKTPVTTGTSVVAVKFNCGDEKGVVLAADTLGSYGSLARFKDCPRLLKVNKHILLGAGGDYADFQYMKAAIEQKIIDEECLNDGFVLKPKSLYCWLTQVMYNKRSQQDPFWNNFLVAGLQDGEPYLGSVDKLGTAFENRAIATGFGAHLALPLIDEYLGKKPNLTCTEAKQLVVQCMQVLFYRDARAYPKYQIGTVTADGVKIDDPRIITTNWDVALMVEPEQI